MDFENSAVVPSIDVDTLFYLEGGTRTFGQQILEHTYREQARQIAIWSYKADRYQTKLNQLDIKRCRSENVNVHK